MRYSNYDDVADAIAQRREFDGNSAWGRLREGNYVVYSYGTEIARFDGYDYTLNRTKYSRTTSRLQGIVRRVWAERLIELDFMDYRAWGA